MSKFISIYNYADNETMIEIPDKEIKSIMVHVLSGDETGYINFTDGTHVYFDASNNRMIDFDDGAYCVTGEDIEKWLNFKPNKENSFCCSYDRQNLLY